MTHTLYPIARRGRLVLVTLVVAALAAGLVASEPGASEPVSKAPAAPDAKPVSVPDESSDDQPGPVDSSTELSDPVESFVPLRPRTPREDDRIRALALFAGGRIAQRRQEYPQALRRYQRAYRYDPVATAPLKEIVPLAFSLDRQAEAVRYALILAEREPSDPVLMRRLAIYLTEQGDTQRALALYEKALELQAAGKPDPSLLVARMEIGRLYFVAKDFDKAAEQFAIVFEALEDPKDHGLDESMQKALLGKPELTYQLMGESFLATDRPEKALAAFEKKNAAKPDEGQHAYNLARVDMKRKQPAQALAKLQPYFDKHLATHGTGPYKTLAEALEELGQTDQLARRLEELRADDPGNVPLAYYLAQHYQDAGQLDKAEPIYADMIARHAERPPIEAYRGLIAVQHAQKNGAPKNVEKLLATLGDAVGRLGTFDPLGESGTALLEDADTVQALLAAAKDQLDADPEKLTYGSRLTAAQLALEAKDFATAGKYFDLAVAAEPKKAGQTLVTWGLELFLANQYADAAKVFQRGLDDNVLEKNSAPLYFYLAGALEMDGRTDEAIEAARKAAELEEDSPRFASRPAWIQYHAKRYDEARKGYQALIEKYEKKHDSSQAREAVRDALLVLSNIAVLENKLPESEEWLEQLLDEFPEDVGALNDLGYLWADSDKHLDLALGMIQKAVADDPKNMAYRDSLGWVLFRMGRYEQAVAELNVAASVEEPDGVILDHLGDALAKAGELPAAVDAWNRAAAAFEKNDDADKAAAARNKAEQAQASRKKD